MIDLFYIVSGSLLLIVIGAGIYALRNLYIEEKNILLDKENQQKLKDLQAQASQYRTTFIAPNERMVTLNLISQSADFDTALKEFRLRKADQKPLHLRANDTHEPFEYQL